MTGATARERAHAALVEELHQRSRVALATFTVALPVVWLLLGRASGLESVRATFGALVVVTVVRHLTLWLPSRASARRRERVFALGAGVTGVLLGALNVLAYPLLTAGRIDLLTVFHAGLMSGALMNIGVRPWIYLLHFVPTMGSLAILLGMERSRWEAGILCLMVLVYAPSLCWMAVQHSRSRTQAILMGIELERLALHDALTGLANRLYVTTFMEKEVARIQRAWSAQGGGQSLSLAILVVDADHFKAVNDTHGHAAGDAVLAQLAQILRGCVRDADLVARWGGEEFLVLARDSERRTPSRVACRIQQRIRAAAFQLPDGKVIRMTCSIGSSLYPFCARLPQVGTWEDVVGLADAGLYRAKHDGRDRIGFVVEGEATEGMTAQAIRAAPARIDEAAREGLVAMGVDSGPAGPGDAVLAPEPGPA